VLGRIRVHLRSIDRDHPDLHHPSLRAQLQHLRKQIGERRLVALAKARDRRVIRALIRRDHAVGDVLHALALDHPRGALSLAVGVEQQREHHPRLVRRAAVTISAVGAIERRQIHLLGARQHEPRKVILRQPLPQIRRQQQLLITVTRYEVLGHAEIVLNLPDGTLCATAV
jgi:hypothetical protein